MVTALHHRNQGEAWPEDEIAARKAAIERAGLAWTVVESIGVGEEIKTRTGDFRRKIDNYKQSIRNTARSGVKVFCYNFMAITDWTRTNLDWRLRNGGTALRFDAVDFAAYDLFILERDGAAADYAPERIAAAKVRLGRPRGAGRAGTDADRLAAGARLHLRPHELSRRARALPGRRGQSMRANLIAFVREIADVAEAEGARLAIHPDDPAFPIFGLPRVSRPRTTCASLFDAVPSAAYGLTLCAGSFGSNAEQRRRRDGARIRAAHPFRPFAQCEHEPDGSFFEADISRATPTWSR